MIDEIQTEGFTRPRSYRDWLNARGIPAAGWVTLADGRPAYQRGEAVEKPARPKLRRVA